MKTINVTTDSQYQILTELYRAASRLRSAATDLAVIADNTLQGLADGRISSARGNAGTADELARHGGAAKALVTVAEGAGIPAEDVSVVLASAAADVRIRVHLLDPNA